MRLYRDHHHAGLSAASVVAIGNFDGVHRGHQALLACVAKRAGSFPEQGLERALVTFEPLPRAFFDPDQAPPRLTGPAEKLRLVREQGVALAWALRFNEALAALGAAAFVQRILVEGLNARVVVVGEDFRFGCGREGDLALLRTLGESAGFEVEVVPAVTLGGVRVSSTAIRKALADGDLAHAEALLGRPFGITGRVVRGQQLGRTLGYPTANVRPWGGSAPLAGVFAVRARVGNGAWRDGIANLGVRPAVGGGEPLLEVHLFDCDENLYGRKLETRFIERLRDETHFDSLGALVKQMNNDESRARAVLAALPAG